MKFLSVRDLRSKSASVWRDLAGEKEMVVTNNGRPVALLTSVDEDSVETALAAWRQVRASQAVANMHAAAVSRGLDKLSLKQVDAEIQAARKARK